MGERKFQNFQTSKEIHNELSFVPRFSEPDVPDHLFHYTTVAGLVGIAKSKSVWLSDAGTLNDISELFYFRDVVAHVAEGKARQLGRTGRESDAEFVNALVNAARTQVGSIFIASFTDHRDQLSQWRAYTDDSKGFNIGFPGQKLLDKVREQKMIVCRCSYDRKLAYRTASLLVDYFMNWRSNDPAIDHGTLRNEFSRQTVLLAPYFKHPSFAEESEWRVFEYSNFDDARLDFRPLTDKVVGYLSLDLEGINSDRLKGIKHNVLLITGPGNSTNNVGRQGVIHKFFGWSPGISNSEIPYRNT